MVRAGPIRKAAVARGDVVFHPRLRRRRWRMKPAHAGGARQRAPTQIAQLKPTEAMPRPGRRFCEETPGISLLRGGHRPRIARIITERPPGIRAHLRNPWSLPLKRAPQAATTRTKGGSDECLLANPKYEPGRCAEIRTFASSVLTLPRGLCFLRSLLSSAEARFGKRCSWRGFHSAGSQPPDVGAELAQPGGGRSC